MAGTMQPLPLSFFVSHFFSVAVHRHQFVSSVSMALCVYHVRINVHDFRITVEVSRSILYRLALRIVLRCRVVYQAKHSQN